MNGKQAVLTLVTLAVVSGLVATAFMATPASRDPDKLQVVATFYPIAYLAQEIGGDAVEVDSIIPFNAELHAWSPSTVDILAADQADVLLYNGAGADAWFLHDLLPSLNADGKIIVKTTQGMDLLHADGHSEDDGDDEHDEVDDHDHGAYDPHTWLGPHDVVAQGKNVLSALIDADPDNENYYTLRWEGLEQNLTALDQRYQDELADIAQDKIIVTHSSFGYLAYRYNFTQLGVIGLSADEQPSAQSIAELVDVMLANDIFTVYTDPQYPGDYADVLKQEVELATGSSVQIRILYIMLGPVNGLDYMEQIEANLESLKVGLEASV